MSKKGLKEPVVPKHLTKVEHTADFINEAREQETDIVRRIFEGAFLTKFQAAKTVYKQTVLKNCRFMGCCFEEAEFADVMFENCDFYNTGFNDACFKNCSFRNCKAVGADFYGSRINHVFFENCVITEAGFDAARFSYVKAVNTDFAESSFSTCRFANTEWENTNFQNVNFFKTMLKGMDFSGCCIEGITLSEGKAELQGLTVNLFQAVDLAKRLGVVIKDNAFDKIQEK